MTDSFHSMKGDPISGSPLSRKEVFMDRENEQRINLSKEEIKEIIKDLEPGTMLTLENPEMIDENIHFQKDGGE